MIPHRFRKLAIVAGTASLGVQTACYSYLPAPGGRPRPDTEVMLELTAEGTQTLQPVLGPRIRRVEGRVQSAETDGATLMFIDNVTSFDGITLPYTGREAIRIPSGMYQRADVRTLDKKRSWVAAGTIGAAFVVVVVTALAKARSRNSGAPGKIGGSPPDLKAP
jgi:hypothetical protein